MNTSLLRRIAEAEARLEPNEQGGIDLVWDPDRRLSPELEAEIGEAAPLLKAWAREHRAPAPPSGLCNTCRKERWWQRKRDLGWACGNCHPPVSPHHVAATAGPTWRSRPWTAEMWADVVETMREDEDISWKQA